MGAAGAQKKTFFLALPDNHRQTVLDAGFSGGAQQFQTAKGLGIGLDASLDEHRRQFRQFRLQAIGRAKEGAIFLAIFVLEIEPDWALEIDREIVTVDAL
jgi:hypothetical protein